MIPVTKPSLCSLDEFGKILEISWESGVLTHHGPLLQRFESQISLIAGNSKVVSVVNGTIALQLALRSLPVKGEVIVPSFTWIATVSAIEYEGFTPIFCDVRPDTFNIDSDQLSNLITDNTVAIMPVHVFGQPCDVIAIENFALKNNLEVIYDAAHAFGSSFGGGSVLARDPMSCVSFHATKIMNSGEGGGIFTNLPDKIPKLKRLRFFGHDDEKNLIDEGTNAKMTEIHAALGLGNLTNFENVLQSRKLINDRYRDLMSGFKDIRFQTVCDKETNYSYFPVVFANEKKMLLALAALEQAKIMSRRYFYPSISTLPRFKFKKEITPVSDDLSKRILCLPSFLGLTDHDQQTIIQILRSS